MKKKPWSLRAQSNQSIETINEKIAWKHARRMAIGGFLENFSIIISCTFIVMNIWLSFKLWVDNRDEPLAPGFWEVGLPILGIGLGSMSLMFIVGLLLSLSGKTALKPKLIPIRCQRCPMCFYDLSGKPHDDETCPECGICAPRRECVRLWCKLLRSKM